MDFKSMFVIIYVSYAIFIIRFYRRMLHRLQKYNREYENLEKEYKPYARTDVKNWSILEIYFGALVLLPIRCIGLFTVLIPCYLALRLGSIGMSLEQEWPSTRYRIVKFLVNHLAQMYLFFSGFWYIKTVKVDYSTYDPEYKQTQEDRISPPSIIVSNHVSWYDTIVHVYRSMPSFLSKAEVANYPIFGGITTALKSVYVDRDSRNGKDEVMEKIFRRYSRIKGGQLYPPLIIFPEGTTTTGKQLISFKKGAFEPLVPIKITCLKYYDRNFSLALDIIGILPVAALSLVQFSNKLVVYEFNGLYNPKYLNLEQYPEEERWVKYADKVKDIMAKCLQVEKSEAGFRHVGEFNNKYFPKLENKERIKKD